MSGPHGGGGASNHNHADPHAKKENKLLSLAWIIAAIIALFVILSNIPTSSNDSGSNGNQSGNNHENESKGRNLGNSKNLTINSEWSEQISFSSVAKNFTWNFICDQPYEVMNIRGKIYPANAFEQPNIGWSNDNLLLKFRTSNRSVTKMRVEFTPNN